MTIHQLTKTQEIQGQGNNVRYVRKPVGGNYCNEIQQLIMAVSFLCGGARQADPGAQHPGSSPTS